LADDRVGSSRPADEIARQIDLVRLAAHSPGASMKGASAGELHWDAKSLLRDRGGVYSLLRKHGYAEGALVPASPWLGSATPTAPLLARENGQLRWTNAGAIPACWWAVQTKRAGHWSLTVLPPTTVSLPVDQSVEAVAVRSIDLFGNASAPAQSPTLPAAAPPSAGN
jgi:hypothetical protein